MSHIVNFCPLTKFDGGLLRLHEADEADNIWLLAHDNNNNNQSPMVSSVAHVPPFQQILWKLVK